MDIRKVKEMELMELNEHNIRRITNDLKKLYFDNWVTPCKDIFEEIKESAVLSYSRSVFERLEKFKLTGEYVQYKVADGNLFASGNRMKGNNLYREPLHNIRYNLRLSNKGCSVYTEVVMSNGEMLCFNGRDELDFNRFLFTMFKIGGMGTIDIEGFVRSNYLLHPDLIINVKRLLEQDLSGFFNEVANLLKFFNEKMEELIAKCDEIENKSTSSLLKEFGINMESTEPKKYCYKVTIEKIES